MESTKEPTAQPVEDGKAEGTDAAEASKKINTKQLKEQKKQERLKARQDKA